jgi:hypothetical protein
MNRSDKSDEKLTGLFWKQKCNERNIPSVLQNRARSSKTEKAVKTFFLNLAQK